MKPRERRGTCRRGAMERRGWDRRRWDRRHITTPAETERRRSGRRQARLERRAGRERRSVRDRRAETSRVVGTLLTALASVGACLELIHQAELLDPQLRAKLLAELAKVASGVHRAVRDARAPNSRGMPSAPR